MQRSELVEKIDGFLAKTGMAPSTFGLKAAGSGHLISRLRAGMKPHTKTVDKVDTFIKKSEAEFRAQTADALAVIKVRGYVQVGSTGGPIDLPAGVTPVMFDHLVESGQLQPAGDSFLGGRSQTYRTV